MRFLFTRQFSRGIGVVTWEIEDADNKEEALRKWNNGQGRFIAQEMKDFELSEPTCKPIEEVSEH